VLLPTALLPFLFLPNILGHLEDKMKDEKQFILFGNIGLLVLHEGPGEKGQLYG
jgi:hypothetical protein